MQELAGATGYVHAGAPTAEGVSAVEALAFQAGAAHSGASHMAAAQGHS